MAGALATTTGFGASAILAAATDLSRLTGGGIGEGFSRTVTVTGGAAVMGARACGPETGALPEATRFGSTTSTGDQTAKYTIPKASRAPVAKADPTFELMFTPRPPRLLVKRKSGHLRYGPGAVKIA
jgi:hypothetical protein